MVVVKIERRGVVGPCVTRSINNNMKWNCDDRLGYAYLSDCYTQSSNPDARHGVFMVSFLSSSLNHANRGGT